MGKTDAEDGVPPKSLDEPYMFGYLARSISSGAKENYADSPIHRAYADADAGRPPRGDGEDYTRGYLLGILQKQYKSRVADWGLQDKRTQKSYPY